MNFDTQAVHVGHDIDPETGAVAPPIVLSTTFARDEDYELRGGNVYGRIANPNRRALEQLIATLEGGAACAAFGSGQAATQSILHALNPGDHVIFPADIYHGTRSLLDQHYVRWGVQVSYVDMTDEAAVQAALQPQTRLLWVETPSNPRLRIVDIAAMARLARAAGAACVVDNTWATPVWQRPLEHGADLVLHSTTKYFGGHSDVTGGAVVARAGAPLFDLVRSAQGLIGAVPSPFDCWLLLRSIPSLGVRVRAQSATAAHVAAFLAAHPRVATVHYPGLASHPGHAIAARQMRGGFGAMLSVEVAGSRDDARDVARRVRLFLRATSLGGYESLIEHRAAVEGPNSTTPPTLLRLSIGLEHADDLVADLDQALRPA